MNRSLCLWTPSLCALLAVVACGSDKTEPGNTAGAGGKSGTAGAPAGGTSGSAGSSVAGAATAGSSTAGGGAGGAAGAGAGSGGGGAGSAGTAGSGGGSGGAPSKTTFFVTSDTSATAKLGGLSGADARCQALAVKAGIVGHTFHAYLSAEKDAADASKPVHAKDRIGTGPWYNSAGVLLAQDLTALHALSGKADLFLDEAGKKINGQWSGSPQPNEHDVLTGSSATGTVLVGKTCTDWTSESTTATAQVGHCDGLGPSMSATPPLNSWNSAHENGSCGNTTPKGGAGRLYCFAIN